MLPSFSPAELKAARTVLEQPDVAIYASVTELAVNADIGETTVLRFVGRLGYRNFQSFKIDLARDLAEQANGDLGTDSERGGTRSVLSEVNARNERVITETYRLLESSHLKRAVELLSKANEIHFYGVGHSGITAMDAAYRLMRLGFPTRFFYDAHFQMMAASALTVQDVVVGISISGSTKDTVEALRISSERGAGRIAITSHAKSPITRFAEVTLLTATRESPLDAGSFTSRVGQLHLLDLLTTSLVRANPDRATHHREQVGRAISEKLY